MKLEKEYCEASNREGAIDQDASPAHKKAEAE